MLAALTFILHPELACRRHGEVEGFTLHPEPVILNKPVLSLTKYRSIDWAQDKLKSKDIYKL